MNQSKESTVVGRVVGLWRYPVKSMAAEPLCEIEVSWHGFAGDRRWAFIRKDATHSGFPWFTLRERANLNHYKPAFVDPARPDKSPVSVQTPSGATVDVCDPGLAAELHASGVQIIKQDRGIFDTFPISLISTQTIAKLEQSVRAPLAVQRFRPNILIDATHSAKDFPEDEWVGKLLRIGDLRLRVDKRDGRCVVICIDPQTTQRNTAILQAVKAERDGCLGVYGSTVQPGKIALNDSVAIESPD